MQSAGGVRDDFSGKFGGAQGKRQGDRRHGSLEESSGPSRMMRPVSDREKPSRPCSRPGTAELAELAARLFEEAQGNAREDLQRVYNICRNSPVLF